MNLCPYLFTELGQNYDLDNCLPLYLHTELDIKSLLLTVLVVHCYGLWNEKRYYNAIYNQNKRYISFTVSQLLITIKVIALSR